MLSFGFVPAAAGGVRGTSDNGRAADVMAWRSRRGSTSTWNGCR